MYPILAQANLNNLLHNTAINKPFAREDSARLEGSWLVELILINQPWEISMMGRYGWPQLKKIDDVARAHGKNIKYHSRFSLGHAKAASGCLANDIHVILALPNHHHLPWKKHAFTSSDDILALNGIADDIETFEIRWSDDWKPWMRPRLHQTNRSWQWPQPQIKWHCLAWQAGRWSQRMRFV